MPLTFEDKQEIHELFARYGHAIDSGAADDLAATFTADGVFDGPGGKHTGTDEIRKMGIEYHEHPDINNTQHLTNSIVADGDGDEANAVCYAMCVSPTVDGSAIRIELINRYEDELRRVDGAWRFQRRVVKDVFPESINDFSLDPDAS
jgi:uncharacterized protein (TIGR02246 family)